MPPRPTTVLRRRCLTTGTSRLRQAPNTSKAPTTGTPQTVQKPKANRIGYVVPVKAFSQETQAFLKDEDGLSLGEVLREGEEGGEGVVKRGSVVEMRR